MTSSHDTTAVTRLRAVLEGGSESDRLQAALLAGTHPDPAFVDLLLERCAVEPDFFVRDMLTWALTRHDPADTVPKLLVEAVSAEPQRCSQALHTLSKIGDPRGWAAITTDVLRDPDEQVVRVAWRAAVRLVPAGEEAALAAELCGQLGRGDRWLQRSLSQPLVELGEVALPLLHERTRHADPAVRTHALATERLLLHPEDGFDLALAEAERVVALAGAPLDEVEAGAEVEDADR